MKKISLVTCSAIAALMFAACGEDSTAVNFVQPSIENGSEVVPDSLSETSSSSIAVSSSNTAVLSSSGTVYSSSLVAESSSATLLSSSAAISSSSAAVNLSSAALDPILPMTEAYAECMARKSDPMLDGNLVPGGDGLALPPVAYRRVDAGKVSFSLENILFACNARFDSLNVHPSGDTLYVKTKLAVAEPEKCTCVSKVHFNIDADSAFTKATLLVLDDESGTNLGNRMKIVDLVDDVQEVYHVGPSDVQAVCRNDRVTAEKPALVNALSDIVDTNSKELPYARRITGADGFDTIEMDEIYVACGIVIEGINVIASGDTLYAEPKIDQSAKVAKCLCPTRVGFKIEQDSRFTKANYLVYDKSHTMKLVNVKIKID